jgi:hypothetical protein
MGLRNLVPAWRTDREGRAAWVAIERDGQLGGQPSGTKGCRPAWGPITAQGIRGGPSHLTHQYLDPSGGGAERVHRALERRPGLLREADGGPVLRDDVGRASPDAQAMRRGIRGDLFGSR